MKTGAWKDDHRTSSAGLAGRPRVFREGGEGGVGLSRSGIVRSRRKQHDPAARRFRFSQDGAAVESICRWRNGGLAATRHDESA